LSISENLVSVVFFPILACMDEGGKILEKELKILEGLLDFWENT